MDRALLERIAEAEHALRMYRAARNDGRLTREEAIYLLDTAFFHLLILLGRHLWLRDFEPRARALRAAHGLAEEEHWEPANRPRLIAAWSRSIGPGSRG